MDRSTVTWPRLNLPKSSATQIRLYFEYPIDDFVQEEIISRIDSSGEYSSGTIYRRNNTDHLIYARAERSFVYRDSISIRVAYDAREDVQGIRVPKSDQREEEFIRILTGLTSPVQVGVVVIFSFASIATDRLWYPLPTPIKGAPGTNEVFEIRGVRGVKTQAGNADSDWDYYFDLGRSVTGDAVIEIRTQREESLGPKIFTQSFDRAIMSVKQLVKGI